MCLFSVLRRRPLTPTPHTSPTTPHTTPTAPLTPFCVFNQKQEASVQTTKQRRLTGVSISHHTYAHVGSSDRQSSRSMRRCQKWMKKWLTTCTSGMLIELFQTLSNYWPSRPPPPPHPPSPTPPSPRPSKKSYPTVLCWVKGKTQMIGSSD